jgi:hypothetical protein
MIGERIILAGAVFFIPWTITFNDVGSIMKGTVDAGAIMNRLDTL